jgi:hypothetical protein
MGLFTNHHSQWCAKSIAMARNQIGIVVSQKMPLRHSFRPRMNAPQVTFNRMKTAQTCITEANQTYGSPVIGINPRSCGITQPFEALIM